MSISIQPDPFENSFKRKKNPKRKNNYVPKRLAILLEKKMITKKTTTEKSPNNFSNLSRLK